MVEDAVDQMAGSLRRIEQMLAEGDFGGGSGGSGGLRPIDPASYVVTETDDLDEVVEGGSVTLQPGDTKTLVEARSKGDGGIGILAVGATNEPEVAYSLRIDDNRVVGGRTNSPLGLINDPLSFVDKFGGFIPATRYVEYEATLSSEAGSSVELAGRLHVQMLDGGSQR